MFQRHYRVPYELPPTRYPISSIGLDDINLNLHASLALLQTLPNICGLISWVVVDAAALALSNLAWVYRHYRKQL